MSATSKGEEVFQVIDALRVELTRLRQLEKDYQKLLEEHRSLIAKIERDKAVTGLGRQAPFLFYLDMSINTEYSASSLDEFITVLGVVPAQSLGFHLNRGDFQAWLKYIGLEEMASSFEVIRQENLTGEALRSRLLEVFKPYV